MSGLIFFITCGVIVLGIIFYNTKRIHYTKWYKEGKPCLSFEEFISFLQCKSRQMENNGRMGLGQL